MAGKRNRAARMAHDEAGSSVVELALVAPIFVMLLLWAVYLTELSLIRLRQQEASRFATWEATTHRLSDLRDGVHAGRFDSMRRDIEERTIRRYANLEGHNRSDRASTWIAIPSIEGMEVAPLSLEGGRGNLAADRLLSGMERNVSISWEDPLPSLSGLLRSLDGALIPLLSSFRFNVREVGVETRLGVGVENLLLPPESLVFPPALRRLSLEPVHQGLETDPWDLDDGGDVGLGDGANHPFQRQVDRIAHFGLGERMRELARDLGPFSALLPSIPEARVVSQRYGDPARDTSRQECDGNRLADTGKWRNGPRSGTEADGMSPAKCFDTLPMEAAGLGSGYEGDPTYRQLRSRGEGFMGCSTVAARRGGCDGE